MAARGVNGTQDSGRVGSIHPIPRLPTGIAAFVGRTLKGPVNRPVTIRSFSEYQQVFGGLWQPSTVSYAVEQYFESGGATAIVVRVANGARAPTLELPAGEGRLVLAAVNPGSREYLRASVDYDGIPEEDTDLFNLVLQRVRAAGSELVEDQEIFRRVSVDRSSARFVPGVLAESTIARVQGPAPDARPDRTLAGPGAGHVAGYACSRPDGDDGEPLSDYDVIGSAMERTGLFALDADLRFDLLCIPPLARDRDLGMPALMVAGRFCRERLAMLLVDPPSGWTGADVALAELRDWPFRSENAVLFFPRIVAEDRLRRRPESFAPCGAAAGMIARGDASFPVWSAAEAEDAVLRPGMRPAVAVEEADRQRLAQAGINTLLSVRVSPRQRLGARTLTGGSSTASGARFLAARRLALFVMASVEQGTRWLTLDHGRPAWDAARAQVEGFLESLADEGAFAGATPEESWFALCDERLNPPDAVALGKVSLLFGFAVTTPGEFETCLVTHQAGRSRVRPVSANRLQVSSRRRAWEVETAILRDLIAV